MKESVLQKKSLAFAVRIVKLFSICVIRRTNIRWENKYFEVGQVLERMLGKVKMHKVHWILLIN